MASGEGPRDVQRMHRRTPRRDQAFEAADGGKEVHQAVTNPTRPSGVMMILDRCRVERSNRITPSINSIALPCAAACLMTSAAIFWTKSGSGLGWAVSLI